MGPNAVAGHGGGGGDLLLSDVDWSMLDRLGVVRIGVRVGQGGRAGEDGQPSGFDVIDDRGNIIVSINAAGGRSGPVAPDPASSLASRSNVQLSFVGIDPSGTEHSLDSVEVHRDNITSNPSWIGVRLLQPNLTSTGFWTISVRSATREMARISIDVRLTQPDSS
jgi:hypothetical protein